MTEALLDIEDLRVTFTGRGREVRAVDGVTYSVYAGQTLAIVGESGSGKTVSCRALIGLLPPGAEVTGSARFQGTELIGLTDDRLREHRGADVAMVFQDPARSLNPTMRVGAQIAEAVRVHRAVSKAQAREQAVDLLRLVHMPLPERRCAEYPHQLSGGMRQRVMIAIALACRPRLLIADEATTALDVTTQAQIMELLLELQAELGMALMLISHDLGLAGAYADEVIVMYAGRIVEQAPAAELAGHVRMPYTQALFEAIPRLERPAHSPLPVIGGRPPDPATLPPGCAFEPRCRQAADDCRAAAPPLAEHEPGHRWACWHPVEGAPECPITGARSCRSKTWCTSSAPTSAPCTPSPASRSTCGRGRRWASSARPARASRRWRGRSCRRRGPPRARSSSAARTWSGLRGARLLQARRHLQMVFQDPFGSLDPKWRVRDLVEEPLDRLQRRVTGRPGGAGWTRCSSWSAWPEYGGGGRGSCPAARRSGWPSRAPWRCTRR